MRVMLSEHESTIRLGVFATVLITMGLAEWLAPRRPLVVGRWPRWGVHLALVALNNVASRFLIPLSAVAVATRVHEQGGGLLGWVSLPAGVEAVIAFVLLDFGIWSSHVAFHFVPWLWRFHRVHHADLDLDVTSGIRFHLGEIVVSAGFKLAMIFLLGPSPGTVIAFETLLNAASLFSHSNVRLPVPLDRLLRWIVVTPDMHRIHHSVIVDETNSNYGFFIPWWDRLFRVYRADPAAGQLDMTIGLAEYRDPRQTNRLPGILRMPFEKHS